ncbi:MAG: DUF4234 domain-containing protein [Oscillospiraceae bacterium]|nr:DUF4234 domain-containing protein [Oscillospiraceae bacterium]
MKGLTSKQYNITALAAGAIVFFFSVLHGILDLFAVENAFFTVEKSIINTLLPVVVVLGIAALFLGNRERAFESKWSVVAGVLLCLLAVGAFMENIFNIFYPGAYYLSLTFIDFLVSVLALLAMVGLVLAILKKNLFKLMARISFGFIALESVLYIINGSDSLLFHILSVLVMGALFAMTFETACVVKTVLRTVAVILLAITVTTGYNLVFSLAFMVLAFIMAPAKPRITLSFITGIIFLVVAVMEFSVLVQAEAIYEIVVSIFCIAAPVLFAVYFLFARKQVLGFIATAFLIVSLIMRNFAGAGLFSFVHIDYILGISYIAGSLAAILLAKMIMDPDCERNPRLRIYTILLSVLVIVPNIVTIEAYYYTMEMIMVSNCVLAAALILAAFVVAPFKYTKYQGIAKHIFLSLFTLGVWQMIWIYNVTKNFNEVADEKRKPVSELLLSVFLPFYAFYWTYKTAMIAEKYGNDNGIEKKDANIIFLLYLVGGVLVPSIFIQEKINKIEKK